MGKPVIPNGYILVPRAEHPIDNMPSIYRDVWMYILKKARHKEDKTKGFKRGQCLISIPELQDALTHYVGYKKVSPTKHQIDNVIRWLRKTNTYDALYDNGYDANTKMITTTRTTRGMIVEVGGYAFFQNPKNYEYDSGYDNENDTSTKRVRQQSDTIHKNVKNVKNEKNVNHLHHQDDVSDEDFKKIVEYYQHAIGMLNATDYNFLAQDVDKFGKSIVCKAIQEAGKNSAQKYKYINAILVDWANNGIKTPEDAERYLTKRKHNLKNKSQKKNDYYSPYQDMEFKTIPDEELPF
ncbi:DnaD domain-containing protein [Mammaliicoccus sciuri]|uniref:DnaD domain protein n=1 Tax=Mammaliicoccus sciuri TaxID=1296 RepID=A0AAI8DKJ3_MAMSC|nr:DnaD domain protein [Mammaliicoccus sciuri]ASE35351.1 DnaD domain protein [Mammaliicoccus sciuri]